MSAAEIDDWIRDVKARPGAEAVGMILVHQGIVRGTTRSGDPVYGMILGADRALLEDLLTEAGSWRGVFAVHGWVNEGSLSVGDDIMKVLVAGDIRDNVFAALQQLVARIKGEVLTESELR
jgi:molybdopterin synthase catalytic subunit